MWHTFCVKHSESFYGYCTTEVQSSIIKEAPLPSVSQIINRLHLISHSGLIIRRHILGILFFISYLCSITMYC